MLYADGQQIELGDLIDLGGGMTGRVVILFTQRLYDANFPESYWSGLPGGMMVQSKEAGLVHYPEEGNPRLELISRSAEKPK